MSGKRAHMLRPVQLRESDANYLVGLISADVGALRAQGGSRNHNAVLRMAYRVRQALLNALGETK